MSIQIELSFNDAEEKCLFDYEQHLASIHNLNDQTEASSISTALTHDVYIGMTDIASEDTWVNLDGTTWDYGNIIDPKGTFPWNTGEPNDANGEHCAHISNAGGGLWNDISCDTKFYFLCNYPGETTYIFNDPSWYSRTPSIGNQIGTIDVLDEFYIEFDFEVHSWPASGFRNIFHIGNTDGERYPAIYTYTDGNGVHKIHSTFGVITNWNPAYNSGAISSGTHHYEMRQTQDYLTVSIDGNVAYDGISDSHSIVFNRPIYLGNNFGNDAADVTISNLIMTTNNLHVPDHFYYTCDTVNRFTAIRGSWTMVDPGGTDPCWGLRQESDTLDGGVAWLGDKDPSSLSWTDYTVEVDIKVTDANSAGQAGILVRAQSVCDSNNCGQQYWIGLITSTNTVSMGIMNGQYTGIKTFDLSTIGETIVTKQYYLLRVEVTGATFKVYFNNEHIFTETRLSLEYSTGSIALRTFDARARFRYFRVIFPSDNELITVEPTAHPSLTPTITPTKYPTVQPTTQPTYVPTYVPTTHPTYIPTYIPTKQPAQQPTYEPTYYPTYVPTFIPTIHPTYDPTSDPTNDPTSDPTNDPTNDPTSDPTMYPTTYPTNIPTKRPTETPTKNPVIDGIIQTEVTQSVSAKGGFNNDIKDDGFLGLKTQEMLMIAILGALVLIIFLCCCIVCIYCHKNKKNKKDVKNIELTEVSPSSPSVEGNGTDFTGGTGGTGGTSGNGNMNDMMRINSVSSIERDGHRTNQTMSEPGAQFETEEPVVPNDNNQQLIQQQFVPMNAMMPMGMMQMPMGVIQNDVMSVAMGMPNMVPNIMPNMMPSGSQHTVTKGNNGTDIENINDLPDEREEEEQNEVQDENLLENDDEYEYYYDDDDEEQDNNMYGKGNNTTSGGQ